MCTADNFDRSHGVTLSCRDVLDFTISGPDDTLQPSHTRTRLPNQPFSQTLVFNSDTKFDPEPTVVQTPSERKKGTGQR